MVMKGKRGISMLSRVLMAILIMLLHNTYLYAQDKWRNVTSDHDIFTKGYVQVVGTSESGQSRYMALRSATLIAQRDLLEVLKGG